MSNAVPTLEELARNAREQVEGRERAKGNGDNRPANVGPTSPPTEVTEDALALAFTQEHRDRLRYTAAWHKWHEWDGTHWTEDRTLDVFEKARALCRTAAARCDLKKEIVQVKSAKTVASVERLARYDRIHAVRAEVWDADKWLLGTPAGVVDLKTGDLRAAKPEDYITKQTAVGPDASVGCPRWLGLLDWATGKDTELVAFLQRMFGYMLTGEIREHALFFAYGTGGNGKGTVVNAAADILGEYATVSPMETFTEAKWDRHPTELA